MLGSGRSVLKSPLRNVEESRLENKVLRAQTGCRSRIETKPLLLSSYLISGRTLNLCASASWAFHISSWGLSTVSRQVQPLRTITKLPIGIQSGGVRVFGGKVAIVGPAFAPVVGLSFSVLLLLTLVLVLFAALGSCWLYPSFWNLMVVSMASTWWCKSHIPPDSRFWDIFNCLIPSFVGHVLINSVCSLKSPILKPQYDGVRRWGSWGAGVMKVGN